MVKLEKVKKQYKDFELDCSMEIKEGWITGLVGQNGALFDKTDVIDTYVFRMTIAATDVGQTVAIGFYQSVLCFITILIANWVVKKKDENYSLF